MTGREYVNQRMKHLEAKGCASVVGATLLAIVATALLVLYIDTESILYLVIAVVLFASSFPVLLVGTTVAASRSLVCPKCGMYWGLPVNSGPACRRLIDRIDG